MCDDDCESCRVMGYPRREARSRPVSDAPPPPPPPYSPPSHDWLDRLAASPAALFVTGIVVLYLLGYR